MKVVGIFSYKNTIYIISIIKQNDTGYYKTQLVYQFWKIKNLHLHPMHIQFTHLSL